MVLREQVVWQLRIKMWRELRVVLDVGRGSKYQLLMSSNISLKEVVKSSAVSELGCVCGAAIPDLVIDGLRNGCISR